MNDSVIRKATEYILSSIYTSRGEDGLVSKFFFGQVGAAHWEKRFGTEIYFRRKKMIVAVLYVRREGPAFLKLISVSHIWSLLNNFVIENYSCLAAETMFQHFECSYAEHLSEKTKQVFANTLQQSIFSLPKELTLYPLVPIKVEANFCSDNFFLIRSNSLANDLIPENADQISQPEYFPPLNNWKGKKQKTESWLGVRSPTWQSSGKIKNAILGAIALTPHPSCRYQFSLRETFGGRHTIKNDGSWSLTFGPSHTPGMGTDIVIRKEDHSWLTLLAEKVLSSDPKTRKQMQALEYFYRAWPLEEAERFPWLFMSLDSIFGDSSRATEAVVLAINNRTKNTYDLKRLKLLLSLRASVIHGGAPDVYDSEKYQKYYEIYGEDPISDIQLIAARCLQNAIFGDAFIEHPDPYAELKRKYFGKDSVD